ncbi:MAG: hypothetical protein KF812_04190 [Fimbriimonadaceae bacterium]|nr:hypothetical protein [Fimbriimonadaceae bacterium]
MSIRSVSLACTLLASLQCSLALDKSEAIRLATQFFSEAQIASREDEGALWGRPLYGPTIFVDAESKLLVANESDREGILVAEAGVFLGTAAPDFPIANTSHVVGGLRFTVVPFQNMPDTLVARRMLVMHESFHRIQADLRLPAEGVGNAHLDTKEGRVWLRLEWRALSVALVSWGAERTRAIEDALSFRAYRQMLFPDAKREEDRMEVHEGLAEYTGVALSGLDHQSARWHMAGRLKVNALKPTYPMSFAYETGPAYALLLDMEEGKWRTTLSTSSSLTDLLAAARGLEITPSLAEATSRANAYSSSEIFVSEDARESERQRQIELWTERLVTGPVLHLPLLQSNFTFNPNEVTPLGRWGNVYPTATISAEWGTITVTKGARISADWQSAYVTAPIAANELKGDGWTLELKPGWRITEGDRVGSFTLRKS